MTEYQGPRAPILPPLLARSRDERPVSARRGRRTKAVAAVVGIITCFVIFVVVLKSKTPVFDKMPAQRSMSAFSLVGITSGGDMSHAPKKVQKLGSVSFLQRLCGFVADVLRREQSCYRLGLYSILPWLPTSSDLPQLLPLLRSRLVYELVCFGYRRKHLREWPFRNRSIDGHRLIMYDSTWAPSLLLLALVLRTTPSGTPSTLQTPCPSS